MNSIMWRSTRATAVGMALLVVWCAPVAAGTQSKVGQDCAGPAATPRTVNVKDKGAKGDGQTDDTKSIQAAIDDVGRKGGTVVVPDGTYMVSVVEKSGLSLRSNMVFKMSENAVLKAIPTKKDHYAVLTLSRVSDVWIVGGTLRGERDEHPGKSGEWGMGLDIDRSSNVTVIGVTARKMWGDGFYVKGATNVRFCNVAAEANRRQGLSIVEADGLLVANATFKNTRGTRPSAGIDIEPNNSNQKIVNVLIRDSKFLDNEGGGIIISGKKGPISNVEIVRNVLTGIRPILIEDAPGVLDRHICDNRQVTFQTEAGGALVPADERRQMVVQQDGCGDSRVQIRR